MIMWGGDVTRGSHAVEGGFLSEALGLSVNLQVMGQKSETRKRLSSKRKDLSLWSYALQLIYPVKLPEEGLWITQHALEWGEKTSPYLLVIILIFIIG